jgi:serine/threonine-protein phosphatase 2A regulatory subunit B
LSTTIFSTADIISAVEFDKSGEHLATGDRGGRVVLFERLRPTKSALEAMRAETERAADRFEIDEASSGLNGASAREPVEYRYLTEFQSHEPEFDYLKSLEIEEKINTLRWCHQSANTSRFLISTNDKTIKLWKVFEKQMQCVSDFNLDDATRSATRGRALNLGPDTPPLSHGPTNTNVGGLTGNRLTGGNSDYYHRSAALKTYACRRASRRMSCFPRGADVSSAPRTRTTSTRYRLIQTARRTSARMTYA